MTRQELLTAAQALVNDPRDAQQLVCHVLTISKEVLIAHPDEPVRAREYKRVLELAHARATHVPMAYLLGYRDFYGRRLTVNRHTLIPRPETEHLVEEALRISLLSTLNSQLFIDIGTGSGAIALTLAAETGQPVIATDISKRALRTARATAKALDVAHLVEFKRGSLLEPIKPSYLHGFDTAVITANLPYLTPELLADSPAEVTDYEPSLALVSDHNDGLDLYRELLEQLNARRAEFPKNTIVLLEIDPRQQDAIGPMVHQILPDASVTITPDLAGHPRVVTIQ